MPVRSVSVIHILLAMGMASCLIGCQSEADKLLDEVEELAAEAQFDEAIQLIDDSLADAEEDTFSSEGIEKLRDVQLELSIEQAKPLASERRWQEAFAYLQEAKTTHGSVEELQGLATDWTIERLREEGDFDKRRDILTTGRAVAPTVPELLILQIHSEVMAEEWEKADSALTEVDRHQIDKQQLRSSSEEIFGKDKIDYFEQATADNLRLSKARKRLEGMGSEEGCHDPDKGPVTEFPEIWELVEDVPIDSPAIGDVVEFTRIFEDCRTETIEMYNESMRQYRIERRERIAERVNSQYQGRFGIARIHIHPDRNDWLAVEMASWTAPNVNAFAAVGRDGLYRELEQAGFSQVKVADGDFNTMNWREGTEYLSPESDRGLGQSTFEEMGLGDPVLLPALEEPLKEVCDLDDGVCEICPSYTFFDGSKQRYEFVDVRPLRSPELDNFHIAFVMAGCLPHHAVDGQEAVVVRREEGGSWSRVLENGPDLENCSDISTSIGQNMYACTSTSAGQGSVTESVSVLLGYANDIRVMSVDQFRDNEMTCPSDPEIESVAEVRGYVNDNGAPVIEVDVEVVEPDFDGDYRDVCEAKRDGYELPEPAIETRIYDLEEALSSSSGEDGGQSADTEPSSGDGTIQVNQIDPDIVNLVEDPAECIRTGNCTPVQPDGQLQDWFVQHGAKRQDLGSRTVFSLEVEDSEVCEKLSVDFHEDEGLRWINCSSNSIDGPENTQGWPRHVRETLDEAGSLTTEERRVELNNIEGVHIRWQWGFDLRTRFEASDPSRKHVEHVSTVIEALHRY